jgi:serine/threonine-protein kinase RsbW
MKDSAGVPAADPPPSDSWHHRQFHVAVDIHPVIQHILQLMHAAGFSEHEQFSVRLALEEALVNALKHGNRDDPRKKVAVSFQVTPEHATTRIEDEGAGFDPRRIPDPLAPENLERPGGRGVFLMRHYMTSVQFNERGNGVTLSKTRTT